MLIIVNTLIAALNGHLDRLDGLAEDQINVYRLEEILNGVKVAETKYSRTIDNRLARSIDRARFLVAVMQNKLAEGKDPQNVWSQEASNLADLLSTY